MVRSSLIFERPIQDWAELFRAAAAGLKQDFCIKNHAARSVVATRVCSCCSVSVHRPAPMQRPCTGLVTGKGKPAWIDCISP
jgi:hypothetical protein